MFFLKIKVKVCRIMKTNFFSLILLLFVTIHYLRPVNVIAQDFQICIWEGFFIVSLLIFWSQESKLSLRKNRTNDGNVVSFFGFTALLDQTRLSCLYRNNRLLCALLPRTDGRTAAPRKRDSRGSKLRGGHFLPDRVPSEARTLVRC